MKIACIADIHVANHRRMGGEVQSGVNRRGRYVLEALKNAYRLARSEKCSAMLMCGDLFDGTRPEPQLITEVQGIVESGDIDSYFLLGNHDMVSDAKGDHALGPLAPMATVIEKPASFDLGEATLLVVPYRPGPAAEWLPGAVEEALKGAPSRGSKAKLVLALHLGLQDGDTPPWLREAHDSVHANMLADLCAKHSISYAVAGNWHEPKKWNFWSKRGVLIAQVGTLAPTGWDNPGLGYGTMAVIDTGHEEIRHLPVAGPRFVYSEEEAGKALGTGCRPHVILRVPTERLPEAQAAIESLRAAGVEGEIEPDTGEAQAALRTAAATARSAETLDEAVGQYVQQMPLEDEALRPEVLARTKRLLGGGS